MTLTTAVEISYLSEDEQKTVAAQDVKVDEKTAKAVRAAAGELTEKINLSKIDGAVIVGRCFNPFGCAALRSILYRHLKRNAFN